MSPKQEKKRQVPLCPGTIVCCLLFISQNHLMKLVAFAASFAGKKAPGHPAYIRRPSPHPEEQRPGSVPSLNCFIVCDLYTSFSLCALEL